MSGDLRATARRWLKFNLVGAIGIGVQLGVLAALKTAGIHYLLATALAVEAAVLHNFVWHERYTWADRGSVTLGETLRQLLKFHVANGAVSLAGNVGLMRLLVGTAHLQYLLANIIAIAACGVANFLLGDRLVFKISECRLKTAD
jgi:putative flippase GtrA